MAGHDHASLKRAAERSEAEKRHRYATGGHVSAEHPDEAEDKALIKKELSHAKIKVKHGGKIDGKKPHSRADKFARGGSAPRGHHAGTKVNINLSNPAEKQQAMQAGMMLGKRMAMAGPRPGAGAPMQARGPMPGAPIPGPGPGSMTPGGPPPMANRGGRFAKGGKIPHLTGGAGGALGRKEKIKQYGSKPA